MKPSTKHLAVLVLFLIILLPSPGAAEVKIELKNGRTIIADFCEESGTSLACSKMGGTFDIEKKDIAKIGEITGGSGDYGGADAPQEAEQESKDGGKKDEGVDVKSPAGEGTAGAAGRIEEIRKRKSELAPERERLQKERERLQEDIKKAPDWMPVKQYDELQKRNAELDEKIKKYNEEVGRLNREEKSIIEESKKKKD